VPKSIDISFEKRLLKKLNMLIIKPL